MLLDHHIPILLSEYQAVIVKLRQESQVLEHEGRLLFCFREPGLFVEASAGELRQQVASLTNHAFSAKDKLRSWSSKWPKPKGSFEIEDVIDPLLEMIKSPATSAGCTGEALAIVYRVLEELGILTGYPEEVVASTVGKVLESVVECVFRQTESGEDEIAIMWALELIDACLRNKVPIESLPEGVVEHALVVVFKNSVTSSNADMLRRLASQKLSAITTQLFATHFINRREAGETSSTHDLVSRIFQFLIRRIDINSANWTDMESRQICLELLFTAIVSTIDPQTGDVLADFHPRIHGMICDELFCALLQICQLVGKPMHEHAAALGLFDSGDLVKVHSLGSFTSDHVPLSPPPPPPLQPSEGKGDDKEHRQGKQPETGGGPPRQLRNVFSFAATTFEGLESQYAGLTQRRAASGSVLTPAEPAEYNAQVGPVAPSRTLEHLRLPLSVLTRALRIVQVLISHTNTRKHLRVQIEAFFNSVFLRALEVKSKHTDTEARRLVLETLNDLLADPSLSIDLFSNFDCSPESTNVYENLFMYLSNHSFPKQARKSVDPLQLISVRCIYIGVRALSSRCTDDVQHLTTFPNAVKRPEDLVARKKDKRALMACVSEFNRKPKAGIQALIKANVVSEPPSPEAVAKFLRNTQGLDKKAIGEFLGSTGELNAAVLAAFVKTFEMEGLPLLTALRMFLESFRLPGEAQMIDRILQAFAEHAHASCSDAKTFPTLDCTYLLCFSIILLNTDLHNPNIRPEKKMSFEAFKINNLNYGMEVSKGQDMPLPLLQSIYDEIKNREIHTMSEGSSLTAEITPDRWRDIIKTGTVMDTIASNIPNGAQESEIKSLFHIYDKHMFSLIHKPALTALSIVYDNGDPSKQPKAIETALNGIRCCAEAASHFALVQALDRIAIDVCKFTSLMMYGNTGFHPIHEGDSDSEFDDSSFASSQGPFQDHDEENDDDETDCEEEEEASTPTDQVDGPADRQANGSSRSLSSKRSGGSASRSVAGFTDVLGSKLSIQQARHVLETNPKAQSATGLLVTIATKNGQHLRQAWPHVLYCILRLFDIGLIPDSLLTESVDSLVIDAKARVQFHSSVATAWKKDAERKLSTARENLENTKGWVSWFSGVSKVDAEKKLYEVEDEYFRVCRAIDFSDLSLKLQVAGQGEDDERAKRKKEVLESRIGSRTRIELLETLTKATGSFTDATLIAFVRGLVLACGADVADLPSEEDITRDLEHFGFDEDSANGVEGDIRPDITISMLSPSSRAARVFGLHLLTEVATANINKVDKIWLMLAVHFFKVLRGAKMPSSMVEKAAIGLLRVALRLLRPRESSQFTEEAVLAIKFLAKLPVEVAPGLQSVLAEGLLKIVDSDGFVWSTALLKALTLFVQAEHVSLMGFTSKKVLPKVCSHETILDAPAADLVGLCKACLSRAVQHRTFCLSGGQLPAKANLEDVVSGQELIDLLDLLFIVHSRVCRGNRKDWFEHDLMIIDLFFGVALGTMFDALPEQVVSHASKLLSAALEELPEKELDMLKAVRQSQCMSFHSKFSQLKGISSPNSDSPPASLQAAVETEEPKQPEVAQEKQHEQVPVEEQVEEPVELEEEEEQQQQKEQNVVGGDDQVGGYEPPQIPEPTASATQQDNEDVEDELR